MFKGVSRTGGDSEGGTIMVGGEAGGSDACCSLAAAHVKSRRYAVAELLQRGRISLAAARDLRVWGLGCKGNG
jgi:hypothetical protein